MDQFVRSFSLGFCLFILSGIMGSTQAQSVFDPNDPIVTYNPAHPPAQPAFGEVGKWVRTVRISGWNTSSFKAYIYKGMPFRIKWPKNYDASGNTKYPLLVFFHGKGERGSIYDNEYQLKHGGLDHKNAVDNGQFNGFLLFPQSSRSDGQWDAAYRQFIKELIEDFLAPELHVDLFRISVNGLSAGGASSWKFFITYPRLVAGCLPISNSGSGYSNAVVENKFTPIWLFQGEVDPNPKASASRNLYNISMNVGGNFTYTEYPGQGHGIWYTAWAEPDYFPFLSRVYKSNPWPLYGRTEFCDNGPGSINTVLGVGSGFSKYQWRKDGVLLPNDTSNTLTVTDVGTYTCRVRYGASTWSDWSPIPVTIKYKSGSDAPIIKLSGLMSKVLAAPDGSTSVNLEVPAGYVNYKWEKVGSSTTIGTTNLLKGVGVGSYRVRVTEQTGCASAYSTPFTVVNADGPNKPDPATNLIVIPLSFTSMKLTWSSNPSPVYPQTNFEVYEATKSGGPYKLVKIVDGSEFSYIREGLTPGTKYYYIVRAINNTAAASVSNEASGVTQKDANAPTAPGNLHVTGTTRNSVSLAWDESVDDIEVARYEIFVNGKKSHVTSETEYTVYNLSFGSSYYFSVRAVDIAGNKSAPSNQVTAQPLNKGLSFKHYLGEWNNLPDFKLLTPVSTGVVPNVTLANASQSENYAFLWEGYIRIPANGNYTFYTTSDDGSKLYLSEYSHTANAVVNNDGLHGSTTKSGTKNNLQKGDVYPIAITFFQKGGGANMSISWSKSGTGSWTNKPIPDSVFVDPPTPPAGTAPAKPSNMTATAISFKRINLAWSDNSNDESAFEIFRSTEALGDFVTVAVLPANTTTFADTLVEPSTTYYYKMRAINQYGESEFDRTGAGVDYAYYEQSNMSVVPDFSTMTPIKTGRVNNIGLGMQLASDNFALKFDGHINIGATGDYTFYLDSDDGSLLYIDNTLVVNNDGLHGAGTEVSGQIHLTAGSHSIRVGFFERTGNEVLTVKYQGPGISKQTIPASILGDVLANATTLNAPLPPVPPSDLGAVGTSNSAIKVTWTNNDANANGIELYRSYNGSEDYVLLAVLPANANSYNDKDLYPSSLFYYKVRAKGEGGFSNYSNEDDARTFGVVPSILPIENVYMRYGTQLQLNIQATSGSPVVITLQVDNLPSFAQFSQTDNGKGVITFNPLPADIGVYNNILVTASNPDGDINTAQFKLTVNSNNLPVISPIPNATVMETTTLQINLSATDADSGDELAWSYTGLPNFATVQTANRNASITFNPQSGDEGSYRIKAQVNDGKHGKDTASFVLTVTHATVTNPNDGTPPLNPKNLAGVFVNSLNGVKLTWTNVAYNATKNEIYRSTYMTGGYVLLNPGVSNNKDDTSYVDNTVTGNKTFYYLVRAVNDNGVANSLIVRVSTPNRAPVIDIGENLFVKSRNTETININASDDPGDEITLKALSLPSFVTFADNGDGHGVLQVAPTGADIGVDHSITIEAKDQHGSNTIKTIKIVVLNDLFTSVYVNFNNKDYPVSFKPWNSFNAAQTGTATVSANTQISNLKDEAGNTTSFSVKLLEKWNQIQNGFVTGDNSGIFPDSILMTGYYLKVQTAAVQPKTIRIGGLNNSKRYNLIFFGSSTWAGTQTALYTVGSKTVSLNTSKNFANTVQINNIVPSANSIDVVIYAPVGQHAVISAMVIQEYDGSIVLPPYNLSVDKNTKNSVTVKWKSIADDATGFEVWRSNAFDGTYTKLADVSSSTLTYTDASGLQAGTRYYYKVRTVRGTEYSEFSDYVSGATIKYAVNINFNDGIDPEPLPWNNTELTYSDYTLSNLVDDNNQPTGINLTILEDFSGFNNWGKTTGSNSGFVSDRIMKEFYYVQYGETTRIMVDGLNIGDRYNFVFYGNCDDRANGTLISLYTIGEKTVQLDARNNTTNTVQINDVKPNEFGQVIISVKALAPGYGFVNFINIQAVPAIPESGSGASPRRAIQDFPVENGLRVRDINVEPGQSNTIKAYPIPMANEVLLRLSLHEAADRLVATVLNSDGGVVYSEELRWLTKGENERKMGFNPNLLPPGVYFIKVFGWKDGTTKVIKVIK